VIALNGPGGKYQPKTECVILFTTGGITLTPWSDDDVITFGYDTVRDLELSGPGVVQRGGGFVGGGFGLKGAVEGMALAGILNAVTTKTSIKTVIRLETTEEEYFFFYDRATPEQLRILLSPVFTRIAQAQAKPPLEQLDMHSNDILNRLERLGALRAAGVLEEDEFRAAQQHIMQAVMDPNTE